MFQPKSIRDDDVFNKPGACVNRLIFGFDEIHDVHSGMLVCEVTHILVPAFSGRRDGPKEISVDPLTPLQCSMVGRFRVILPHALLDQACLARR